MGSSSSYARDKEMEEEKEANRRRNAKLIELYKEDTQLIDFLYILQSELKDFMRSDLRLTQMEWSQLNQLSHRIKHAINLSDMLEKS